MSDHIFSLVIRGGTVIDGTGSDPVQADVVFSNGYRRGIAN
jgi:N-acyl-D-aspartate/D-glutamate deacylase